MIATNALLAGLTCASLMYIVASLAHARIARAVRKVGGIHFFRVGRHQFSYCRCRQPAVPAARMAAVTKRAQAADTRRLDAIAKAWCNG